MTVERSYEWYIEQCVAGRCPFNVGSAQTQSKRAEVPPDVKDGCVRPDCVASRRNTLEDSLEEKRPAQNGPAVSKL